MLSDGVAICCVGAVTRLEGLPIDRLVDIDESELGFPACDIRRGDEGPEFGTSDIPFTIGMAGPLD